MNSKDKGSLAVGQCIGKLCSLGFEILLPIGGRQPYDLVFDDEGVLKKVQVKFAGLGSHGGYSASLRITGGSKSFNYARKYKDEDFDYLYVYTGDGRHFLIKWNEINNRNSIKVDDPQYSKYLV